uniref:Cadherin domain-containing protein n=1 Tax=Petromyzon marinus TaxID=7757 RepID=S4RHW0_PETMA
RAMVHVRVKSVNRHAPEFLQGEYSASVDEAAEPGAALVRVEASDGDCSPLFGRVCDYQILTAGAPFSIDSDGVIRATERLSYELHGEQQLTVAAYDCGKRRSAEDALVTIGVRPVCRPGWQGWNKRVEYDPGSGGRALFPGARLETCGRRVASARATVELQTAHIGKGCDRETYAENSRRKLCGASTGGVDLLPSPELPGSWTQGLPTEVPEGPDSTGERVFLFDGTRAALVPDAAVPANLTHRFTLAAWLRHGPLSGPAQRSEKEAILCNSDKAGMNRHHYSLYIHNCRLVFLLRSEFSQTDTFRPAEFHWKLDQV